MGNQLCDPSSQVKFKVANNTQSQGGLERNMFKCTLPYIVLKLKISTKHNKSKLMAAKRYFFSLTATTAEKCM